MSMTEVDEILTWDKIPARFPDQWVFIVDMEIDEQLNPLSGRVICSGRSRTDVSDFASRWLRRHRAGRHRTSIHTIDFTGAPWPPGTKFAL